MNLPENDRRFSIPPPLVLLYSKSSKRAATNVNVLLVKAFRNLVSGEDDELNAAYAYFHKMVEQEQGAVRNATLAAVEQLKKKNSAMHTDVGVVLATTKRTEGNTETLMASTGGIHKHLESKTVSGRSSLLASKAIQRSRSCSRT